jgi:hypothetical protein
MKVGARVPAGLSWVLAASVLAHGCDWLENRFKTCKDVRVDLVNSQQTLGPIHIAGPDESVTAQNRLESGDSRALVLCLERGDRKRFRAADENGNLVGLVTCVSGKASYEGQPTPRVVWFTTGFACEDW